MSESIEKSETIDSSGEDKSSKKSVPVTGSGPNRTANMPATNRVASGAQQAPSNRLATQPRDEPMTNVRWNLITIISYDTFTFFFALFDRQC